MDVVVQLVQVRRRPDEVRTPGDPVPGVERLVVVRDDRLGDLVLTLPAVAALRCTYPEARLALAVRRPLLPLAGLVDGVDTVMDTETDFEAGLEAFGPDLVVCISRGVASARSAARAGVRHRVGTGHRLHSALFHRRVLERRRHAGRHECEHALSFAHRAGAPAGPATFAIETPPGARREIRAWLEQRALDGRFVVLHPGSGGSCPAWPAENYVRLARLLTAARVPTVVSVGPADRPIGALFADALPALPRFESRLEPLIALLHEAAAVVSNSTGPLHLAAALGTPTLGFYPPWASCAPARWGPYAANGWALVATAPGAERWSRGRRMRGSAALMGGIDPDTAARCVLALLRGEAPEF